MECISYPKGNEFSNILHRYTRRSTESNDAYKANTNILLTSKKYSLTAFSSVSD